jgi:ribosomal protein S18 acetylase RimI-like enzyme
MEDLSLVSVPADRLDDLLPVWRSLYEHHFALTPHLHDRSRSLHQAWLERQRIELAWLASEPDSFVIAARLGERYVGYAFVRIRSGADFAASWSASDPLAELAVLAVLPEARSRGIGSALLDAVEDRLRELQIDDLLIGVITTNLDAARLYERRGAVPFVTEYIHRVSQ